jgi:Domain of unknown function (DUF6268)
MKSKTISKLLGTAASLTFIYSGPLRAQSEQSDLGQLEHLEQPGSPGPPEERYSIMLGGSMTGAGDVEYSGNALGDLKTTRYNFEASYMIPHNEQWMFEVGLGYNLLQTDQSLDISLIPEDLTKIALNLRAMWRINDKWGVMASISPGFYGDDEVDASDALNAPLMVLGQWQKSEDVSVSLGVRVDMFSEMPVLPVFSVDWKISPEWQLALGAPRTELRYQWSKQLSLYGGAALEGESYAVDNPSLVTPSGKPLSDTYLAETEIRALLGFEYQFDSGVKLSVEGGYAFLREFDYHEEDVKLEVDPGAFGAVSVSYSF